ncbi:MAG: hypothetical protein MUE41_15425 [Gemmatimonadaceae bacterium]|nr:hypothetical protein [Gemmatimonadaceae bacterium]
MVIESIGAGGVGIARDADGRILFVPRTAPGDTVEVTHRAAPTARFARARLLKLVHPGPDRVTPPCPHYDGDGCGGCQLQHLAAAAQRTAKARIVADAFARIARQPIAMPEVVPSPEQWRYRRKATFTLRPHTGGFHAADDPERLVQVTTCPITDDGVVAALLETRAARELLPADEEWRVSVRRLDADTLGAVIDGGRAGAWPALDAFARATPRLDAIWWRARGAPRAMLVLDRRADDGTDAAPAFAQVNAMLAERLHADVVRAVVALDVQHVIDAYAGTGAIAREVAAHGAQVSAIEVDPTACDVARRRAPPSMRVIEGDVASALGSALPADAIVVNPPRAGLGAEVPPLLDEAAGDARALVYVSCDPATLARDVARLPRWRVAQVRCYDLFPQTAHVETVVSFVPVESPT